ncbi:MAG: CPBP family glutamic-type intramembrane protease [Candidatus Pacebacteria bacterium]|nr:CPBP family glutamic-type intramembrane protease [Candidatus Paceibacterota bacterium]
MNRKEDSSAIEWVQKVWGKLLWGLFGMIIIYPIWPSFFPYHPIKDFWETTGNLTEWFIGSKYLFIWAVFWGLVGLFKNLGRNISNSSFTEKIQQGFRNSLYAGFFEEILFRWILLYGIMITLYIGNWFLGGFLGEDWGVIQWLHNLIKAPIANFFTFGYLESEINHSLWYAGAAVIVTNGLFRDGHKYQGWFGWVNSWFGGMFLFYIMFNYGLIPAIIIHFSYNMTLYLFEAFVSLFNRRSIF